MTTSIEWETEAAFAMFPIGTAFRITTTRRFGFLWRKKEVKVVEAKVTGQDVEIVKRNRGEQQLPFFHSVIELNFCKDQVLGSKRFLLEVFKEQIAAGKIELLFIPETEVITRDGITVFRDLSIGDIVRAFENNYHIEGRVSKVIDNGIYEITEIRNPNIIHKLDLRKIVWYNRKNGETT